MQALLVIAWMLSGAAIALVMVRRGHSPFLWWILVPCGPLLVLLALSATDEEVDVSETTVREGGRGPGALDVLVGVDGHDGALHACRTLIDEMGPSLGRITLAVVLDYDVGQVEEREVRIRQAALWLNEAADAIVAEGGPDPRAVVLIGKPADELVEFARVHARDLIVVADHSHRMPRHLAAGRVTHGVMAGADCPVLIVPALSRDSRATEV